MAGGLWHYDWVSGGVASPGYVTGYVTGMLPVCYRIGGRLRVFLQHLPTFTFRYISLHIAPQVAMCRYISLLIDISTPHMPPSSIGKAHETRPVPFSRASHHV